jgi:hypothetical protein
VWTFIRSSDVKKTVYKKSGPPRRVTKPASELQVIPGVGPSIAQDLHEIGITRVAQLKGADPEKLYRRSNEQKGVVQDRCLLYVFRCAVYYASRPVHEPEKLKWWNWKDKRE